MVRNSSSLSFITCRIIVIGMALVGFSADIGIALGDNDNGPSPHDHRYGIGIAVSLLCQLLEVYVDFYCDSFLVGY